MTIKKYITSTMKSANGRLQYDKASLTNFVKNEMPANVPFWLSLIPKELKRSNEFNAYYFACILKRIEDATGYRKEELHEQFKLMFNPETYHRYDFDEKKLIEDVRGGSTRKMSLKRFGEYIEDVKMFAIDKLDIDFEIFESWVAMNPDEVEQWERRSF